MVQLHSKVKVLTPHALRSPHVSSLFKTLLANERNTGVVQWRKKSARRTGVRRMSMSMYARELGTIPEETIRVARVACPKGTLAMRLRDELGELYQDEYFASLYRSEERRVGKECRSG